MVRCIVAIVVVMGLVAMVTDARRMTAAEIVDGLMQKSPYRKQLEDDELLEKKGTSLNSRRDSERLPAGVRAKLVILSDDADEKPQKKQKNRFTGCASCGGTNLDTKQEMPFLYRLMEVMTSLKLSTQDGTRNVLRTAFPVVFRPDHDQEE